MKVKTLKRKRLTIEEKVKIIKFCHGRTQEHVARHFKLPRTSVSSILQNKNKILESSKNPALLAKRVIRKRELEMDLEIKEEIEDDCEDVGEPAEQDPLSQDPLTSASAELIPSLIAELAKKIKRGNQSVTKPESPSSHQKEEASDDDEEEEDCIYPLMDVDEDTEAAQESLICGNCGENLTDVTTYKNHMQKHREVLDTKETPEGIKKRQSYSVKLKQKLLEELKTNKDKLEVARKFGITLKAVWSIIRLKDKILSLADRNLPSTLARIRQPRLQGTMKKDLPKADVKKEKKTPFSRKSYTMEFKVKVLKECKNLPLPQVAEKFGISMSSVRSFLRQDRRMKILKVADKVSPGLKRVKPMHQDIEKMEQKLLEWIEESKKAGNSELPRESVQTKAIRIYYDLKISGKLQDPIIFTATTKWLDKFRKKHNLTAFIK